MIEQFRTTLVQSSKVAGSSFSGIGLIVTDFPEMLPIVSLRPTGFNQGRGTTISNLGEISKLTSEFHDGFHILSSDAQLLYVSQYFSPPIVENLQLDYKRQFGGRYLAALFGSLLPRVILTGIVSQDGNLSVFERGREVVFEVAK